MTEIRSVKCACKDCVCVVEIDKAVKKESKYYCGDTCAEHHKQKSGCDHAGCECKG
ncbi:metallothionein [Spartinivicinus poritis]|uniref:Metallothionein n=1 Tax=Spartinivicinus poritis TaxID=2994640 RepID=A0ABT5UI64_9GAMM|nr:metallothionein [Spartinivicinus sp. A2-2]MDE1465900.1 metallothionein [Spartinivicinus sp. A2-2]